MAYAQQIEQKREAFNYPTPPKAYDYYYDQYSRNDESRFLVEKRAWKTLKQNNSSDKYLTDKELEYISLINGFLKNSRYGVEYFARDYLCEELEITDRQLRTIRTNTSHIFKTKWRKATRTHKGRLENVYAVRPTEDTVFLLGETNYYKFEYNSFVNDSVKSVKLGSQFPTSIYNDEKNINIRSRANFSNVKNSNSQNLGTEPEETKNLVAKGSCFNSQTNQQATEYVETPQKPQVVETTSPKAATVTSIRTKAPRHSNKRRTRTNAEQKQLRAVNTPSTKTAPKVVYNGFLSGGKRLSEIQPYLTDELCEKLRSSSGKLFTNKAIREITKSIAVSDKGSLAFFYHINGVVSYLTPALANEKRDPNKIGGEGYYTLAGMTAEDKLLHEREKYLNQVENSGIHTRCDYTQYRARIAGQFPVNLAYDLLTNMVEVKKQEHVLKVTIHKLIPLGENYMQLLLNHAKGIGGYAGVNKLEFVEIAGNSNIRSELTECRNSEPKSDLTYPKKQASLSASLPVGLPEEQQLLQLPQGKWGKVCTAFVSEYGSDLYRYWLAGLEVTEDSTKGTIELRTSSGMVRDRIVQTYLPFLSKVAGEFGINKVEFVA